MLDINTIRADTPAVEQRAYLHNAGSALMPRQVVDAHINHIKLEAEIGGYEAADQEAARIQGVYQSAARLINASSNEIALTPDATTAWQRAFYSYVDSLKPGDRILIAEAEYAANHVACLQVAQKKGMEIDIVPSDKNGQLDVGALDSMITERSKLIAVTWVPTNGGLVNPATEIGKVARAHNVPYLLDACQAVGQMPVDVKELGCDMLSATGRKFLRGPRGTGFLYVSQEILGRIEPAMLDHYSAPLVAADQYKYRDDARRFETWEKPYAALLGLGAAIDYALEIGIKDIEERCRLLSGQLRKGLSEIRGVQLRDLGISPSAIVSFTIDGHDAKDVAESARKNDIKIGVSNPASTWLDAERRQLPPLVRASPHYYNTEREVGRLIEHCARLVAPKLG